MIEIKTTAETTIDCSVALDLIKTIKLRALFVDWAYDTNFMIDYAE